MSQIPAGESLKDRHYKGKGKLLGFFINLIKAIIIGCVWFFLESVLFQSIIIGILWLASEVTSDVINDNELKIKS